MILEPRYNKNCPNCNSTNYLLRGVYMAYHEEPPRLGMFEKWICPKCRHNWSKKK